MDTCTECRMPAPSHASDCPLRRAAQQRDSTPVLDDIARWMQQDSDVRMMVRSVMNGHEVASIAALPEPVTTELHEVIRLLLEEAPTVTHIGDPRRT